MEQGHVRVGPDTITDPAFLVTRNMEDFVTWVDTSKIKRHVQKYNVSLAILPRLSDRGPSDITRTYRTSSTTSISWPSISLFSPLSGSQSCCLHHLCTISSYRTAMHLLLITEASLVLEAHIRKKRRDMGGWIMTTTNASGTARPPTPIRATNSP